MTARGGVVHWARRRARRPTASSPSIVRADRRPRGRQGEVDGHAGDRAQRGAGRGGHRRLGDRPRRADRAARRRPAQPHPRPGDPPQPHRDPRHLRRRDGRGRGARPRTASPTTPPRWPRRPVCTCGRGSCDAEVAVSGANFAVAETGTLAVVESEGNGRMCLTLPRVLVTVMGIEKVVPTWRDLEIFLQVLPRSSTGERMNPYTSMWTGVTPGDGPQEFHLVLLDNGRTATLADPDGRAGAALHPLLGLPQRLPGLRADRRARVRLRLPGPDRCGAVARSSPGVADERRRCRSPRRCAAPATRSARSRSTSRRCSSTCARKSWRTRRSTTACAGGERALMTSAAWTMSNPRRWRYALRSARAGRVLGRTRGRISTLPPPLSGVDGEPRPAAPPKQSFRDWWSRDARWLAVSARDEVLRPGAAGPGGPARTPLGASATDRGPARRMTPTDACSTCWPERLVDYRAVVHRASAATVASWSRLPRRARRRDAGRCRTASPPEWLARLGRAGRRRPAADHPRARRRRRGRDHVHAGGRRDRDDRPRRRGRARVGAPSAWCPTTTCRGRAPTGRGRGARTPIARLDPCATGDLDQRPERDQRHRARPRRGRPRPAHPRGRPALVTRCRGVQSAGDPWARIGA